MRVIDESADRRDEVFWGEIFQLRGSVTPYVLRRVLVFAGLSLAVCLLNHFTRPNLAIDLVPYNVAGAMIGLLLVFRTNAGYDRWYEGRKLWGGLVNDTRNLAVTSLAFGPEDASWRASIIRWIASYGHICRASLRGEPVPSEVVSLLGAAKSQALAQAGHMPTYASLQIGELLRTACDDLGMDRFGFLEANRERGRLLDHLGGCERIQKTPIPLAWAVNIRRFIFLFLAAAPFALLETAGWFAPLVTILIAYPILALDQLGAELQSPFVLKSLNHLPLDEISARIQTDVQDVLAASDHSRTSDGAVAHDQHAS